MMYRAIFKAAEAPMCFSELAEIYQFEIDGWRCSHSTRIDPPPNTGEGIRDDIDTAGELADD